MARQHTHSAHKIKSVPIFAKDVSPTTILKYKKQLSKLEEVSRDGMAKKIYKQE